MNGHDGAAGVVGAGQKHGVFHGGEACGERFDLGFQFAQNIFAFARELEKGVEIGGSRGQFRLFLKRFFEALAILQQLLALLRLVPEIWGRKLLLELV
jgi:hypothetical protein